MIVTQHIMKEDVGPYTYKDFKNLPEGSRVELHNGYIYNMATPTDIHQDIQREVLRQFSNYLFGKSCKVWDNREVRLFPEEDESDYITYIPDLFVLCDQSKDMKTYIKGAPDLVIEIRSKSTGTFDMGDKRDAYELSGVKEYWVIRNVRRVFKYTLTDKGYYIETPYISFNGEDIEIPVDIWNGRLAVKLGQFVHQIGEENP